MQYEVAHHEIWGGCDMREVRETTRHVRRTRSLGIVPLRRNRGRIGVLYVYQT